MSSNKPKRVKSDGGYTIVEVIIAIIIIGFVAVSLLSGVQSGAMNSQKIVVKQEPFLALASVAELVSQAPFETCNQNTPGGNPYASLPLPQVEGATIEITKVSGMTRAGNWMPCGAGWPSSEFASLLQLIEIKATYGEGNAQVVRTREVTKLFASKVSEYGNGGLFRVKALPKLETFWGASSQVQVRVEYPPAGANVQIYVIPGGVSNVKVVQSTTEPGLFTITIPPSSASKDGTAEKATVEFGAYDVNSSKYARPATLQIAIFPPFKLGDVQLASVKGSSKMLVGDTATGNITDSVQLSASGGNGTNATFTLTSGSEYFNLTSSGLLSIKTGSTTNVSGSSVSATIKVAPGGGDGKEYPLVLNLKNPTSMDASSLSPTSCAEETGTRKVGGKTVTTYFNKCYYSVKTTLNSGMGNTVKSPVTFPTMTFVSPWTSSSFSTVSPTASWVNADTLGYWTTSSFWVRYELSKSSPLSGDVCFGKTTGATINPATVTWNDPFIGLLPTSQLSAKC